MILRARLEERLTVIKDILIDRDFKVGTIIELDGKYYEIKKFLHKDLKVALCEIESKRIRFVNLETLKLSTVIKQINDREISKDGYSYLIHEYNIYKKLRVGSIYYGDLSKNYKIVLNLEPLEVIYVPYCMEEEKDLNHYILNNTNKLDIRLISMLGEPKYIHYKGSLKEDYVHKVYLKLKLLREKQ